MSQSWAALLLLEGVDVSQRDTDITPAWRKRYSTNGWLEHRFSSPELSLHHARSRRSRRQVWHRNLQEREQQFSGSDYRGELWLV